jgi:hypothetical protein
LHVLSIADQFIDCRGERVGDAAALARGNRHIRDQRPAGVDGADELGLALGGCAVGLCGIGVEFCIGAAGLKRQRTDSLVIVILKFDGLQPLADVLLVPFQ